MGTTISLVLASTLPQVAKNIKVIVALAPTAFMTHLRSPIKYLAPFTNDLRWIAKFLGINELAPTNKVLKMLSYECEKSCGQEICENLLFVLAGTKARFQWFLLYYKLLFKLIGFNKNEFNMTSLPKIVAHDPAGTSTKTLVHYAQEIWNDGKFQQYDYGPKGNMIKYGTLKPPQYKLANIKRPIYLVYALNDIITSYIDVKLLSKNLTTLVGMYQVPGNTFGHIDFIFGNNAFEYVYKPVVKLLKKYPEGGN